MLPAAAWSAPSIGVVGPLSGPAAILGEQIRDGAAIAAGGAADLAIEDDLCTAEGGRSAAERLVAADVRIVVGFLCTESIEAAMPVLAAAGIPAITVGVRTDSLTDRRLKTGWPVFRLGPRGDSEREAVAEILTQRWREELFAIVDDGTIYARELAESLRLAAEQSGLEPVFVDNYRPLMDNQLALVGRLRRTEATHVFVGGDRDDIAILGRDAASIGVPITIAGGESLRAAPGEVALAVGTLMIGLPEWADEAAPEAIGALAAQNVLAEGYVLPAYAAVEIARAALAAADAGGDVAALLAAREFPTAIGAIDFDENGDLARNPFGLFRYDGERFRPVAAD